MNNSMMNPVYIDANRLMSLGFSKADVDNLVYVYNNGGKFTTNALQSYGYTYDQAKRLIYMYGICAGKYSVETKQESIKHLKKMNGSQYKITMQDLAVSNVTDVPRVAVINITVPKKPANMTEYQYEKMKEACKPFTIWNSSRYKGRDALYKVLDVTGQHVTIETSRKPQLQYNAVKKIPGVLEIKGQRENGNVIVVINSEYCKLCNRFIIVASLRNPEFHHGKYELLAFEGTKVYVYATNMGVRNTVKYNMGTQRVYAYGIFPQDIKPKLDNITKSMYQYLNCVSAEYMGSNKPYEVITRQQKEEQYDDIIE